MPSNKARLYVGLYARGGKPKMPGKEDTYHWALIVGPKKEEKMLKGTRYHAKNSFDNAWVFEERETSLQATNMLLIRVMIGKVLDSEGLRQAMHGTPVDNKDPTWNCVFWIKAALVNLAEGKIMGTSQLEWQTVRNTALSYVEEKKAQHRFDDGALDRGFDTSLAATFDLLAAKEVIP